MLGTLCLLLGIASLLVFFGLGPVLFLLRRDQVRQRLLYAPVLGLATGVVVGIAGAGFGWIGQTVSWWMFIVVSLVSIAGLVLRRPSWEEAREALVLAAPALLALPMVCWPLLKTGYQSYFGLANPDMAFYIALMRFLTHVPLREPGDGELNSYRDLDNGASLDFFGPDTSVVLGSTYFFPLLSKLTGGLPISHLFVPLSAVFLLMVPVSVWLLADAAGLGRRAARLAMCLSAVSSIVGYTFYLNSLGSMSVVATVPAVTALLAHFLRTPAWGTAGACVLGIAGMFLGYFPGFGVLGVAAAGWTLMLLLTRRVRLLPAIGLAAAAVLALLAPNPKQGMAIAVRFVNEALSSQRQLIYQSELLLAFARGLTEEGIPFVWGLLVPNVQHRYFTYALDFPLMLGVSLVMTGLVALTLWRRFSPLDWAFLASFGALLGVTGMYASADNAYGVFKMVAWLQPFLIVAFVGGAVTVARAFSAKQRRLPGAVLAALPLVVWAAGNISLGVHLGQYSLRTNVSFNALQELARIPENAEARQALDEGPALLAVSDPWGIRWIASLLPRMPLLSFPYVELDGTVSSPRSWRNLGKARSVLFVNSLDSEVGVPRGVPALWRGERFTLARIEECKNCLFVGRGWYRPEGGADGAQEEADRPREKFRWFSQRGELLLMNPVDEDVRLSLSLGAGFGGDGNERKVHVLVNGLKIDELTFHAQARLVTKPFRTTAPCTQIELLVDKTVGTLQRRLPLWKRWVPAEARRLNVALYDMRVVAAEEGESGAPAQNRLLSSLDGTTMMANALSGYYADRWISREGIFELGVPPGARAVEVAGMVPGLPGLPFPFALRMTAGPHELGTCRIATPGQFTCRQAVEGAALAWMATQQKISLGLYPVRTFTVPDDPRELSVRLDSVALTQGGAQP